MIATFPKLADLLDHVRKGTFDPGDVEFLEGHRGADLVSELRQSFPITFQERHIGQKWEIAVARRLGTALSSRMHRNSLFVSLSLVPVYIDCVLIGIDREFINGVTRFSKMQVRPSSSKDPELRITTSRGFSLDRSPDGWALEPRERRTVRLKESFLKSRGWQFHHLTRFIPSP